MSVVLLRPVQAADRLVVGEIAFQTGFFGQSAACYFPAPALFAALWTDPYFRGAGFAGFVAELDGQVVGYILGAPDERLYQAVLRRSLLHAWSVRPGWAELRRCAAYLLRAVRWRAPHADWTQYPAHLHLNLLPAARGQRLGARLLHAHLITLCGAGVPGVQLSTTAENQAALRLYRRVGFREMARRVTPLWEPWLGHPTAQVVMALGLLELPSAAPVD